MILEFCWIFREIARKPVRIRKFHKKEIMVRLPVTLKEIALGIPLVIFFGVLAKTISAVAVQNLLQNFQRFLL